MNKGELIDDRQKTNVTKKQADTIAAMVEALLKQFHRVTKFLGRIW